MGLTCLPGVIHRNKNWRKIEGLNGRGAGPLFMITTNRLTVTDAHPIQVGLVALALFTITLFAPHIHTTH